MIPPGPKLQDIKPPPPPPWWPPAYGWWVVVALLLMLAAAIAWWLIHRHRARRGAGWLAGDFERLREAHAKCGDDAWLAGELSQRLRRAARLHDARAVTLRGDAWHAFLVAHAPHGLDVEVLCMLEQALYQPRLQMDAPVALNATEAWLRHAMTGR